jgi:hypothetical protein
MNDKQLYWQKHLEAQQECGLGIKAYCTRESLNCATFQYWRTKYQEKKVPPLIPVQIKSINDSSIVICTLVLRDGARIEFRDGVFVREILERYL